jgi:hypothetical protein
MRLSFVWRGERRFIRDLNAFQASIRLYPQEMGGATLNRTDAIALIDQRGRSLKDVFFG